MELASTLTAPDNWKFICDRFKELQACQKIRCLSIPIVSISKSDKEESVLNWWREVELESIRLSLDYDYLATTDITDCYGALYTHTIAWALHGKAAAKLARNDKKLLGNSVDNALQDMQNRQTNGIPQGNVISDLVAELVLGYADLELEEQLDNAGIKNFQILRYRDDYRIFTNSAEDARMILLALSQVLEALNFKLNSAKTQVTNNVIDAAIKPDKKHWITSVISRSSVFKSLLIARDTGMRFPNSGSLVKALGSIRKRLERVETKPDNNTAMIAVIADIMSSNPRIYPQAASLLSKLVAYEDDGDVVTLLNKLERKFSDTPNIGFLDIWLQRISLSYDRKRQFTEPICQLVVGAQIKLWNSDWLTPRVRASFESESILDHAALQDLSRVISLEETEPFLLRYDEDIDDD